jgi:hypothetical protein
MPPKTPGKLQSQQIYQQHVNCLYCSAYLIHIITHISPLTYQ